MLKSSRKKTLYIMNTFIEKYIVLFTLYTYMYVAYLKNYENIKEVKDEILFLLVPYSLPKQPSIVQSNEV